MGFKLGKLADYIRVQGGFAYKSKDFQNSGTKKVLKIKNIRFGYVDYNDAVYISDELAHNTHSWATREGDILISMTGSGPSAPQSLVGRVARVWAGDETAWINQRVGRIVLKAHGSIHLDFIFYLLSQKSSQDFLVANSSGSANQANISGKTIEMLPCPLISYEDSSKIATILLSLDQKINLNHQINQTLEQMAQTLFKSWFVDFDPVIDNALDAGFFEQDLAFSDELLRRVEVRKAVRESDNFKPLSEDIRRLFPNAFEECTEPALGLGGWVPKGWNNGCISDVAHYRTKRINTSELTLTNYISTENMLVDRKGIQKATALPTVNSVPAYTSGTILISNIRPYFKKIWLAKGDGGYSNDVLGFEVKDQGTEEYLFNLMYQDSFFDFMMATSKGSKMPRGDKKAILGLELVVPPLKLRKLFSKNVNGFYTSSSIRNNENHALGHLRDTLLPKLISGELSLSNIKIDIPEETLI
ncbi:restriction endonuclease subunit S [Proteus mirabilis]|uniref:restriction endonuclease subunit S n=1 Tax=Proteus mirabilis TaxID=584 RepID=UPI0002832618|nr:restriction endonuclease subunit S [Proteus mirabilis]EKA99545.1 hypothetical protein HMPREF1311_01885 [Proteus mirabilis WGLW6]MCT0098241.1 restriction endonuclease subunit S [Proteus mirabilis]HBH6859553.1 restriction endonuclease subunit S [Proteus mirabilis]